MPADRPGATRDPNLFIVGAPKAGTSALYHYLGTHPKVFLSAHKEPHFFDHPPAELGDGLDAYLKRFAPARPEHEAIGEGSTGYLSSAFAVENIHRFRSDARLVAMLRNPVELVQSLHAEHCYQLFEDEPEFREAWALQAARRRGERLPKTNPSGIQTRMLQYETIGRLGEQVARLLEVFPRRQVHLIVFDDFVHSPSRSYARVLEFLGLPLDGRTEYPRVNPRRRLHWPALARRVAQPPKSASSMARAVKRRLGVERLGLLAPLRRWLGRVNTTVAAAQPLSVEFKNELTAVFRDDVALLGNVIERDLGHWLS